MVYHCMQRHCLLCHCRLLDATVFGLCRYCHQSLPFISHRCQQCSLPLPENKYNCGRCLKYPPAFDQALCSLEYSGPVPTLIQKVKNHHDRAFNRLLGELLLDSIRSLPAIDMIIPVPMHWWRNLGSGHNHSHLPARLLADQTGIPCQTNTLIKQRRTLPQKGLTASKRRRNLRHAFAVKQPVQDCSIAVVDDVITTTSTMNEVARTLKAAGASQVFGLAIARAL